MGKLREADDSEGVECTLCEMCGTLSDVKLMEDSEICADCSVFITICPRCNGGKELRTIVEVEFDDEWVNCLVCSCTLYGED